MHVSVAYKIRAHLANLPPGAILSSQGLIHLGPRGALDMALSRLNSDHRIKRKAWGIYVNTPDGEEYDIAPQTLAEAKAQAFNKTVLPFGKTIAHLLKFPPKLPNPATEQSLVAALDTGDKAASENVDSDGYQLVRAKKEGSTTSKKASRKGFEILWHR
jgi:hypothetical protein